MNLSPKLRALLGVLSVAVTTFGGLIATDQVLASSLPSWVGVVISVLGAVLAYLLAPSALGGTQQGLVNPSLTEPPAADVEPVDGAHLGINR
jgi:Na+-translocating ferredoxin:NAD+ oxidoreductase RnfD subunit